MKKVKNLLLGLFIIPSLAIAGCGKKDKDNDDSNQTDVLKQSLSWIEKTENLREAFNVVRNNYTMTAKNINFTVNTSQDEYGENVYSISNPTYGDVSYKIILEDDAILFDAGDKREAVSRNDEKYYSFASELALDGTKLKQYKYKMTSTGWSVEDVVEMEEQNAVNLRKKALNADKEKVISSTSELYISAGWNRVANTIYDSEKEIVDEVVSWYDSATQTYKIPDNFNETISSGDYYESVGLTSSSRYYYSNGFKYFVYDEYYEGYKVPCFSELSFLNVKFKLDGQKISSLSYDVYMTESVNPNNGRKDYEYYNDKFVGLHIELTDFGTSNIVVGDNLQASRTGYTGVEASKEQLTAARTFYNNGNYTVSYKTTFTDYNKYGFGDITPEYEHILKVTPTSNSVYRKYYNPDLGSMKIEHWIDIKVDETNYIHYNYDWTSDTWYKYEYEVAEGQTTDEMFAAYKTYYWHTEESTDDNMVLDIDGGYINNRDDDYVKYSHTLKSFILNKKNIGTSYSKGEDELRFSEPLDAIYNFNATGLNFYMSRHTAKYQLPSAYAFGYMIKTIENIGTTVIEAPTEFELGN